MATQTWLSLDLTKEPMVLELPPNVLGLEETFHNKTFKLADVEMVK